MRIRIVCIGESKLSYLKAGEQDFVGRLKHYTSVEVKQIRPIKHVKSKPQDQILQEEASLILNKLQGSSLNVALDSQGRMFTSEQLARQISNWQNQGKRDVVFIIGGPLGLHKNLLERADLMLSISRMTFTHDMIRLILLEQIYRAYTILKGEKYHK